MRAIAVLNQKGGVGKTTTVTNTAAALATMGAKVLVIDLDPQAHLTIHLGVEPQSVNPGSYEVMMQSANIPLLSTIILSPRKTWKTAPTVGLLSLTGAYKTMLSKSISSISNVSTESAYF